jgi:uncharacterized repeat protein (TIGR01451 family)
MRKSPMAVLRHIVRLALAAALALVATAATALADPLSVTSRMLVERRVVAADGTASVELVAPIKVVPGDRVLIALAYRNTGTAPIADLVLANPVPKGIAFRSATPTGPTPEMTVDGQVWGPLPTLSVALPTGARRPAVADDVVTVRWRLAKPIAPGAHGDLAFAAVLK